MSYKWKINRAFKALDWLQLPRDSFCCYYLIVVVIAVVIAVVIVVTVSVVVVSVDDVDDDDDSSCDSDIGAVRWKTSPEKLPELCQNGISLIVQLRSSLQLSNKDKCAICKLYHMVNEPLPVENKSTSCTRTDCISNKKTQLGHQGFETTNSNFAVERHKNFLP